MPKNQEGVRRCPRNGSFQMGFCADHCHCVLGDVAGSKCSRGQSAAHNPFQLCEGKTGQRPGVRQHHEECDGAGMEEDGSVLDGDSGDLALWGGQHVVKPAMKDSGRPSYVVLSKIFGEGSEILSSDRD